jgi:predicted amidophosphoribosyltransferase
MMPAMFAQYVTGAQPQTGQNGGQQPATCPECQNAIPVDAKFCPACGHQLLVFTQCSRCSKNLTPNTKFCPRCGHPTEEKLKTRFCPTCGNENMSDAIFCNDCGEKL